MPEDEWDHGASLCDPEGVLPNVGFLKVPEPKTVKNRLHIDLQVSGGRHIAAETRAERILAMVEKLVAAGAREIERHDQPDGALDSIVMADPEGNEFCVV